MDELAAIKKRLVAEHAAAFVFMDLNGHGALHSALYDQIDRLVRELKEVSPEGWPDEK